MDTKLNQNWFGQIIFWMQFPAGVIVVVGIILAKVNTIPNSQAHDIMAIACHLRKETLCQTAKQDILLTDVFRNSQNWQ